MGLGVRPSGLINSLGGLQGGPLVDSGVAGRWTPGPASVLNTVFGSGQNACEVTNRPTLEAQGNVRSEFTDIIAEVVGKIAVPVTVLNVTMMGAFRSDAHIGTWSHPSSILDCSHWCLPGVPDAWNELVFASLLRDAQAPQPLSNPQASCWWPQPPFDERTR
ncbi:hypothetical protein KSP40_PGU009956 [Platanthera guangdongensis]|uniref:Trichome birefringence-like C-terminal domain-containing protein n=1 Tax=Platanthera guangdongensis TaxID=2320717 RepID=A0ABR2M9M5_9ASPA